MSLMFRLSIRRGKTGVVSASCRSRLEGAGTINVLARCREGVSSIQWDTCSCDCAVAAAASTGAQRRAGLFVFLGNMKGLFNFGGKPEARML
jgi:hypothetical protein